MNSLIDRLLIDFGPQGIIILALLLVYIIQNNKLNKILVELEKKVPFSWIEDKLKEYRSTETCDATHNKEDS